MARLKASHKKVCASHKAQTEKGISSRIKQVRNDFCRKIISYLKQNPDHFFSLSQIIENIDKGEYGEKWIETSFYYLIKKEVVLVRDEKIGFMPKKKTVKY